MDAVIILRELWHRRVLVAVVAVFAIAIGGMTAYRPGLPPSSRHYEVGIASARALVDTPNSQVVDLGAKEDANAGVLPARATLLATLLTTSPLRDQIAKRAHVAPDRLLANADTPTAGGPVDAPLATGSSLSPDDPKVNVVTLKTDVSLPLITVNTQAPDAATAAALANSTVSVLEAYLSSVVTVQAVPAPRRLVVKQLGEARSATEQRGPSRMIALGITLLLFGLGCTAMVVGSAMAREWRSAAELERELAGALDPEEFSLATAGDGDEPEPQGRQGRNRIVA